MTPEQIAADKTLPPAIAARMASVLDRRIADGLIANDGRACATAEARYWHNDLLAWKAAGSPADQLPELKRRRAELRDLGHNV